MDRVWNDVWVRIDGGNWTGLSIRMYYSLGGMNYWTYKNEDRGYYLSVTPVRECRTPGIIESSPMDGIKKCVLAVSRKSAKREAEAVALAKDWVSELVRYVCAKIGADGDAAVASALSAI